MQDIRRIVVIYNPKSTGWSLEISERFQRRAQRRLGVPVDVVATKRRGHAEKLAAKYADAKDDTMIVSCSGDGGYHEVVNGVLNSKNPAALLGLLPGGNANDHYSHMHTPFLYRRIEEREVTPIDVLRIRSSAGWERYAHSYAGLGMTAELNEVLQHYEFHPLREVGLVVAHILKTRPVAIEVNGKRTRYDNIIFLNAGRMSKFVKTAPNASITDGQFELVLLKKGSAREFARYVVRAATVGMDNAKQRKTFTFTCRQDMAIQMDGEQRQLVKGEKITVTCVPKKLNCII
jgi:diacylglycerol kinase family enzyme